jgi:hypothetical protein
MEYFIREQRRVVEPLIAAVYSAKLGCVATCSARRYLNSVACYTVYYLNI